METVNTTKRNYNKSLVMKQAWVIYRSANGDITWSDAMKQAWTNEKAKAETPTISELYVAHYKLIYHYVLGKVRSAVIAEEVTNDIFLKASDYLSIFDASRAKVTTWLYNIAKTKVVDYYRTDGKKAQNYVPTSEFVDANGKEFYQFTDTHSDSSAEVENSEMLDRITDAMAKLKPNYRKVAELYFVEQKQYSEIAEILNISMSNVKVSILRAKAMLQEQLQKEYAAI